MGASSLGTRYFDTQMPPFSTPEIPIYTICLFIIYYCICLCWKNKSNSNSNSNMLGPLILPGSASSLISDLIS